MNLSKLFEMQKKLDEDIMKRKGLEGQDLLPKKILALQVELGELANEWRGFKFWSKDQEPRREIECHACKGLGEFHMQEFHGNYHTGDATEGCAYCETTGIQKRPLLEEYVDCLHSILGIGLELGVEEYAVYIGQSIDLNNGILGNFESIFSYLHTDIDKFDWGDMAEWFVGLGSLLGLTWEQIEQAYFDKHAVNLQRQRSGY